MRVFFRSIYTLFIHRDIFLNILVCIIWGYMFMGYLRGIINHIPVLKDYTDQIEVACFVVPLLLALPALLSRFLLFDYFFFGAMVMVYILNYCLYPENTIYLNNHAFDCLCLAFPMYFIGRVIDIEKYYNVFFVISAVCIVFTLFYYLHYAQTAKNMAEVAGDDNMYTAYRILPHVVFILWVALRKFNILAILLTLMGVLFLFSCGTRGPILCLVFFGVFYFLFFMNFKHAFIVKGIILGIGALIILFVKEIIMFLVSTFTNYQLSTRILDLFVEGNIGLDSGRSSVKTVLKGYLDSYGGLGGLGYFGSERFGYIYPHDIYLDFCIAYGYIIGTVLFLLLWLLLLVSFFMAKNHLQKCFIVFLSSFTVVKFFLSGSFVTESFYYILIGYCVGILISSFLKSKPCISQSDK